MFDTNETIELNAPVSFCGGGGERSRPSPRTRPSVNAYPALHDDPISNKMDRDNSTTQGSQSQANGDWTNTDVNSHAAAAIYGNTNNIGGCTGCHVGKYDANK